MILGCQALVAFCSSDAPERMITGWLAYAVWLYLEVASWWRPYLFGGRSVGPNWYFAKTYKFLPQIDQRPTPDADHIVLQNSVAGSADFWGRGYLAHGGRAAGRETVLKPDGRSPGQGRAIREPGSLAPCPDPRGIPIVRCAPGHHNDALVGRCAQWRFDSARTWRATPDVVNASRDAYRPARSIAPTLAAWTSPSAMGESKSLDGNHVNPFTDGFICGKVRHFPELMYGSDRLMYPAVATGPRARAVSARELGRGTASSSPRGRGIREQHGGEAILPYCYGGSNGWLTQDALDARFSVGSARRDWLGRCAPLPTSTALWPVRKTWPASRYEDYPQARLIVLWGVNPSVTGIHLVPLIREAQAGAQAGRGRSAPHAAGASGGPAPGGQTRHGFARGPVRHPLAVRNRHGRSRLSREHHASTGNSCASGRPTGPSSGRPKWRASGPSRSRASPGCTPTHVAGA